MRPVRRKQVTHWDEPGHVHELTFSCYGRRPLLLRSKWPVLLSRAIDAAIARHRFGLVAFVYMPEHVHLLVCPREPECRVADLLYAIKRPVSYRVRQELLAAGHPLADRLCVRERPGKRTFRFWQEAAGYDRNLYRDEPLTAAMAYLHGNPVRRGLCRHPEQWKWSSYRHYECPDSPRDHDLPTIHGYPDA